MKSERLVFSLVLFLFVQRSHQLPVEITFTFFLVENTIIYSIPGALKRQNVSSQNQ